MYASTPATSTSPGRPPVITPESNKETGGYAANDYSDGNEPEHYGAPVQRKQETNAYIATNAGTKPHISDSHIKPSHIKPSHNLKTIKRSNKVLEALALPTLSNLNPRSLYNKINEFQEFVLSEDVDIVFLSETWER